MATSPWPLPTPRAGACVPILLYRYPALVCCAWVAGFLFQRHGTHRPADPRNPLPPGFYAPSLAPSPVAWAVVRCPTCGKLSTVGVNHVVLEDGTIRPSYVCPFPPCAFHVMARLVGWRP